MQNLGAPSTGVQGNGMLENVFFSKHNLSSVWTESIWFINNENNEHFIAVIATVIFHIKSIQH